MYKHTAVLSITCLILTVMTVIASVDQEPDSRAVTEPTVIQTVEQPLYIARDINGVVGICEPDSTQPVQMTGIRVSSLREYDQALLRDGLPLYSETGLTEFLEDFDS
ncbi:MAG: hypothetical protein ACI4PQ_07940 [Butyricicoccaceae bacterium]